ncbi:Cytochrome P450 monooxygenase calL [Drechslerella dactyloides]|uniref:Cytochrome P450 monooxygenase calL n=1 Tax=Drechslerella dactyloides TaxID=74499 RepID=A0AAD6NEN7_DREDA|nr:Cytochrome P450 monooxygenase calL [Drechslerella dactyloides]
MPWLGSAIPFSRDFDHFIQWVRKIMPPDIPYSLYLGGRTIYLVTSPRLYAKVIRISKTMSFDLLERDIFRKIFEMPKQDLEQYCIGMHGVAPPPGMSQEEANRIEMATKFAGQFKENWFSQTEGLKILSQRFIVEWERHIDDIIGKGEVKISLKRLIEHHFFWAATSVHFGSHLKDIAPDAAELFWEFEEGFLKLFQDTPRWMLPGAIRARDKLIGSMEKWLLQALEKVPEFASDEIWNEWWGGRILWQRVKTLTARGLSLRAKAVHQFGLLWGLNANTPPVISWMLIYILRNPLLLPKLQKEVESAIVLAPKLSIDWSALMRLPLFLSVYQESLRLSVSNMTARIVTDDTDVDGYIFKKGRMMLAPSRALHLSPVFDHPSHPVNEFWGERFLVDEGEKLKMMNSWRPFAGGITYCPGRYVAAAEIYGAIGILILKFDMRLEEPYGSIQHSPGRAGTGAVRPDRDGYIFLKRK